MTRVAIVQKAPAFLNRAECLRIAVSAVAEAAAGGAQLIVFPEAFVPGYPAWIWRLRPGGDLGLSERLHRALLENAVDLADDGLGPLREAAREHRVMVVSGVLNRTVAMMPVAKVTDIALNRSIGGRLLGYGEFVMESAGQKQALRNVRFMPYPEQLYLEVSSVIFGTIDESPD